jgi:uncharacterized membrane protein YqhA
MKNIYATLKLIVSVIAGLIFVAGLVLTILGGIDFIHAFDHISDADRTHFVSLMAVSMLRSVDMFLLAIVLYVFSLGLLMLFAKPDQPFPIKVPEWLRITSFTNLKLILWEAILTTLVVSYIAGLVEKKINGEGVTIEILYIPGGIFLIATSLFFLKKGEH